MPLVARLCTSGAVGIGSAVQAEASARTTTASKMRAFICATSVEGKVCNIFARVEE